MSNLPRKSFGLLYKEFALPLTKFIVKRTGGNQDAVEEVFSRTITAAWSGYKTFRHKSSFFTWICRIALNKMADYYREEINKKSQIVAPVLKTISGIASSEPSFEEKMALEELKSSIKKCIKLLPQEKRKLLHLRYWKELTTKEIAESLGTSERAVEGKLYRARTLLAQALIKEHIVEK